MIRRALTIALLAFLAACGASPTPAPVAPPARPSVAPSTAAMPAFVGAYRRAFPALASGRTDKGIRNDGRNTCRDVTDGEPGPVLLRRVVARFEGHDGTPPTARQAAAILTLVRAHCVAGDLA